MPETAQVRGKFMIVGAIVLTVIGSAWGIAALALWRGHPVWSIPAGVVATAVLLALCVVRLWPLRKVSATRDGAAAAKGKRMGQLFGIVVGVESGLIFVSATMLARLGLGIWIPIAIAIIVGLHFIPLARVFEAPVYYATGILCVVGVVGCSVIRDAGMRLLCAGLAMAAALWLSALWLLVQAGFETAGDGSGGRHAEG